MYHTTLSLALTALSIGASGLAIPANPILANAECEYTALKNNQSAVFGWQLAGVAQNTAEKDAICNSLPCNGLASIGFNVQSIKAPSCSPSQSEIDATSALPNIIQSNSAAFTTMLTNAFDKNDQPDYKYLCTNIRFVQLRSFSLNDAQIVNATCNQGGPGAQIGPQPFTSLAKPNDTAVADYKDSASKLFAHNYAATASSPQQLRQYCNRVPSYQSNFEALQLDSQAVSNELCRMQTVPTASETQLAIRKFTSLQFITVIENISNVPGWRKFMCEQLDIGAMDRTGLNGAMIKAQVCADVRVAASS